MKSLGTLLKVAQRKLDELGVEVARIAQDINALREREASVRAREQAELASSTRDPTFASMLPAYRLRVKWQIDDIKVQIAAKEASLAEVRERLSAAYIEKSKFEQLIEQTRIREMAERAALEQAQLDEVAINRAGGQRK